MSPPRQRNPREGRRSARGRIALEPRGVVTLAALDLRREPEHASELTSQLLMGETVEVRAQSRGGAWLAVRNLADGYQGWVRSWGLVPCGVARAGRWRARARTLVTCNFAEARTERAEGALVSPLFWNSRVIAGPARRGFRSVELPDGRRGFVPATALATRARRMALADRVRELLGIPYLWGGRTTAGFDCSALTQQLWSEQNLELPRDAREQFTASEPVTPDAARLGDLLFFGNPGQPPGHVGMALENGYYVHARGRVRIQSIDPGNVLCDNELMKQYRGVRRPVAGRWQTLRGGGGTRESA